jgi:ribonuclease P protein component
VKLKLGKDRRVCGRSAVDGLFKEGRGGFVHPLRYLSVQGGDPGLAVLVSVPKKLHKRANKRNVLKRRMREAFRLQSAELHARAVEQGVGIRLALIYAIKDVAEYKVISDAVEEILARLRDLPAGDIG